MDPDEFREYFFEHLNNLIPEFDEPRGFIGGQFDSNQTTFERLSNQGTIGVKAFSYLEGKCLLRFLRYLVDGYWDLFWIDLQYFTGNPNADSTKDLQGFAEYLAEQESIYTSIYDISSPNNPIVIRLLGSTIERTAQQVFWWDLDQLSSFERYEIVTINKSRKLKWEN